MAATMLPATASDKQQVGNALPDRAEFCGFEEIERGDEHVVPAGIVRRSGPGGARLNCFGGVGAAHEVEPVSELALAVAHPEQRRDGQHHGEEDEGPADFRLPHVAAAQRGNERDDPGEEGEDPAVVAGEDGGDQHEPAESELTDGAVDVVAVERAQIFDQEDDGPDHLHQAKRLVERGGLRVEQAGVQREEKQRDERGPGLEPESREPVNSRRAEHVRADGWKRPGEARLPPTQLPHKGQHQHDAAAAATPSQAG